MLLRRPHCPLEYCSVLYIPLCEVVVGFIRIREGIEYVAYRPFSQQLEVELGLIRGVDVQVGLRIRRDLVQHSYWLCWKNEQGIRLLIW